MTGGAPFILDGEFAVIRAFGISGEETNDQALGEGGEGHGVVQAGLGVEDTQLYGPDPGVGPNVPPAEGVVVNRSRVDHQVHVILERLVVREGGGETGAGEGLEDLDARGVVAGVHTLPVRGVDREGQKERHLLGEAVVGLDNCFLVRDAHVDVLTEDHLSLGDPA